MLIEKEEKTGRSLTYDDLRRLLILALLIVLGIFAVYTLKHVLLLVAVVFIVGMVFNPVIAWLERRGLRRVLALLVLVLAVLVVVGLIVWLLLPPFVDQVQQLIQQVPEYSTRIYNQAKGWLQLNPVIQEYFNAQSHDLLGAAGSQAGGVAQLLLRSTLGAFGGLIDLLLFFLLLVFALSNPVPIVAACLELVLQNVREPTRRTLARNDGPNERVGSRGSDHWPCDGHLDRIASRFDRSAARLRFWSHRLLRRAGSDYRSGYCLDPCLICGGQPRSG
jgi:predicted PurR-regulated permease PerM